MKAKLTDEQYGIALRNLRAIAQNRVFSESAQREIYLTKPEMQSRAREILVAWGVDWAVRKGEAA